MSTADSYEIRRLLKALAYAAESSVGHFAFWDELRGGSRELDEYDVKNVQLIVDMVHALAERAGIGITEGQTGDGALPEESAVKTSAIYIDPEQITSGTLRSDSCVVRELVRVDLGAEKDDKQDFLSHRVELEVDWLPSVHVLAQLGDRLREINREDSDASRGGWDDGSGLLAERDEPVLGHDASPSAGEGAEPGQDSTVSVGAVECCCPSDHSESRVEVRLQVRDGEVTDLGVKIAELLDLRVDGGEELTGHLPVNAESDVPRFEDEAIVSGLTIHSAFDDHASLTVLGDDAAHSFVDGCERGECFEAVGSEVDQSERENCIHHSSPSAGEGAEPGLASTPSVEGEPATGGPFQESPVALTPSEHGREINPAALRSIRELAGVRSGLLAQAAGISHSFLSNIEAGRKQPSPAVTHQLARRLGVPIDAITQTA